MKALILVAEGVEDLEFFYPYYRLLEAGWKVDVAGPKGRRVAGKNGYEIEPDMSLADVKPEGYDLLILPGGKAPETVRLNERALAVTRAMMAAGKPVAAICHGPQILISAGVLQGRKATCWKGIRDDLKAAGAEYLNAEVVVDGKLITSRCPDDLPAFCREIFKVLAG
jgi:protease I